MGVLTEADLKALEMACEAYAEVRECRAAVEMAGGGTYETRNLAGAVMTRSRPELARISDADRRFRGYLSDFGLTPAARARVHAADGRRPNPLDRYFS
jgi:P27 family predicted phage terminase small subunit